MKTIENLYNEVQGNDDLKKEFVTSFKEGKVEEFLKAHDCNATAADVQEFLNGRDMEELADDDLDNVAGGSGCGTSYSCGAYDGNCVNVY